MEVDPDVDPMWILIYLNADPSLDPDLGPDILI